MYEFLLKSSLSNAEVGSQPVSLPLPSFTNDNHVYSAVILIVHCRGYHCLQNKNRSNNFLVMAIFTSFGGKPLTLKLLRSIRVNRWSSKRLYELLEELSDEMIYIRFKS